MSSPLPELPEIRVGVGGRYTYPWQDPLSWVYAVTFALAALSITAMAGAEAGTMVVSWSIAWVIGFVAYLAIQVPRVSPRTLELFMQTWCSNNGMTLLSNAVPPSGAPIGRNLETGEMFPIKEAMEGELNGFPTTIYQFGGITEDRSEKKMVSDSLFRTRAARVEGPPLPVSRLYMHPRWVAGIRFEAGFPPAFKHDDPISTESVEFNKRFVVTMESREAQIWARRILDPNTINQIVKGGIELPEMAWYEDSWWFIDRDHQTLADLATYQDRHRNAVTVMAMMARVQSL